MNQSNPQGRQILEGPLNQLLLDPSITGLVAGLLGVSIYPPFLLSFGLKEATQYIDPFYLVGLGAFSRFSSTLLSYVLSGGRFDIPTQNKILRFAGAISRDYILPILTSIVTGVSYGLIYGGERIFNGQESIEILPYYAGIGVIYGLLLAFSSIAAEGLTDALRKRFA